MSTVPQDLLMRTKIIATLGPACTTRECLTGMLNAGLDACRLNFSHGDHDSHGRALKLVRELATERDEPVAVIGDLCGPKIRLGTIYSEPITLETGARVQIVRGTEPATTERLTTTYPQLVDDVQEGHRVYIDDGLVRLIVRERTRDALVCEVTAGGALRSAKGINLPDTPLSLPSLTDKDRQDLEWAIANELDYVALSFVREPEDLYELRRILKQAESAMRVIVKIEKREALWHIDELIAHTDAVLIARGDLGVETDLHRVPLIQKDLVADCRQAGVPVIVATQMLQSMIEAPAATRAEVSDVANAIIDQADAVMLSGETAVGQYPVESVRMMNRIASATEEYLAKRPPRDVHYAIARHLRPTAAVAHAAVQAARDLGVRLVAAWSATGATAQLVAQHRLPMPVVGLTHDWAVHRQMNLLYGVIPVQVPPQDHPAAMMRELDRRLLSRRLAAPGDRIVIVTSTKPTVSGATNTVLMHRVGDEAGEGEE
jgi:pyruvate kinase